jgi:hypothetical protein
LMSQRKHLFGPQEAEAQGIAPDSAVSCFAASGAASTTGPSMYRGPESHRAFFG